MRDKIPAGRPFLRTVRGKTKLRRWGLVKRIILLATMLVLIPSLSLPELAAQEASGTIEGRLVNGTAGGSNVADIPVQLLVNHQETGTPLTTKTGVDGQFSFSNLSTDPKDT